MIRLHHAPETRSMRVLWLLHELGEPFEVKVWPFGKELRSDEYAALHPVGRVPALEIDGTQIWESGAMIEVLCERFHGAGLGRAVDHPERADWLTLVHFAETISQHSAALTQQHIMLYPDDVRSPVVTKLEPKRIARCYAALEGRLAGQEWLLSTFSAADVAVGQAVYMARHFARTEEFANVHAWMQRCEARPAYQASLPQEGQPRLYPQSFYEPIT